MKLRKLPIGLIPRALTATGDRKASSLLGSSLKLLLASLIGMLIQLTPAAAGVLLNQGSEFICGDSSLGTRTLQLSGDLRTGGTCVAGNGYITSVSKDQDWDKIELDSVYSPSTGTSGLLKWTISASDNQGSGSVSRNAWEDYSRVMLGVRFYDSSSDSSATSGHSPDVFFVELRKPLVAGAWLAFTFDLQQTLSGATRQIGLFGSNEPFEGAQQIAVVSAPSSAALLALGLVILSAGFLRRRFRPVGPQGSGTGCPVGVQ